MKFASRSAKLSFNSAKDGSKASSGRSDAPRKLALPDSRREDLEDGRRGVVGRERGLRVPEVDLFALLPASVWGVLEDIPPRVVLDQHTDTEFPTKFVANLEVRTGVCLLFFRAGVLFCLCVVGLRLSE